METRLMSILDEKGHTVHCVPPTLTVLECANKMHQLRIGALIILEKEIIVGIVSERDIINAFVAHAEKVAHMSLKTIMTSNPLTVKPDMSVTEAMELVTEKRFRHLPVVDNGKLIGMVSIGDLTRCVMLAQKNVIQNLTTYIHGDQRK